MGWLVAHLLPGHYIAQDTDARLAQRERSAERARSQADEAIQAFHTHRDDARRRVDVSLDAALRELDLQREARVQRPGQWESTL